MTRALAAVAGEEFLCRTTSQIQVCLTRVPYTKFVATRLARAFVFLALLCVSCFAQGEPKDRPTFVDYPVYVTRSELILRNQQWKLTEVSLAKEWSGWHYNQQTRQFTWEHLPQQTKVWQDANKRPIYMSRCLSILAEGPPPPPPPPPCPAPPITSDFWWIPWLLFASALLVLLWVIFRNTEFRKRVRSLSDQLAAETLLAQQLQQKATAESVTSDQLRQDVTLLQQEVVLLRGKLKEPVKLLGPRDTSSFLLPPDGCVQMETSASPLFQS